MPRDKQDIIDQIDALLARAGLQPGDSPIVGQSGRIAGLSSGQLAGVTTSWLSAIERLTPPGSQYRAVAEELVATRGPGNGHALALLAGLLNALRADYEAGYAQSLEELVHAEVFGDFLEMAAELVGKGYKDAAAVITGSVLEEHIRKLSTKHRVPSTANGKPKKADTLNADLVKASSYNGLVQKQVTAWLDLRNKAAHGKYDQYSREQVELMLDGVRTFLIANPA